MFIADNMDVAIREGFCYSKSDNRNTLYLETIEGEEIKVPEEKLKKR